ncbi:putative pectinesterase/pectinesterase inhibitor 36 [Curcuma longa]|uniref:putative pectinesterase/pectinesterase inhibitor 36 n=1 Tax=Curcuma longa TaxID=136217 RepID=UPI003D9E6463
MAHQENMVTALQGRDDPNQNTGIAIHPRIESASGEGLRRGEVGVQELPGATVEEVLQDGVPEGGFGWAGGPGGLGQNTGEGAETARRVKWPGFHVLREDSEAAPFTVERFIQGQPWIAEAGVPFWPGLQYY